MSTHNALLSERLLDDFTRSHKAGQEISVTTNDRGNDLGRSLVRHGHTDVNRILDVDQRAFERLKKKELAGIVRKKEDGTYVLRQAKEAGTSDITRVQQQEDGAWAIAARIDNDIVLDVDGEERRGHFDETHEDWDRGSVRATSQQGTTRQKGRRDTYDKLMTAAQLHGRKSEEEDW